MCRGKGKNYTFSNKFFKKRKNEKKIFIPHQQLLTIYNNMLDTKIILVVELLDLSYKR